MANATQLTSSLSSGRPNTEYSMDLVKCINDWLPRQPRCWIKTLIALGKVVRKTYFEFFMGTEKDFYANLGTYVHNNISCNTWKIEKKNVPTN